LLIAVLRVNGINDVNAENIENYVKSDCDAVSNFIVDNLLIFVDKYNQVSEIEWLASSVEAKSIVFDIDTNEKYIYLDFDKDNGYALVGNQYNFLEFSPSGDLLYTKTKDILYWSNIDGFVYEENGEFLRCGTKYLSEEDLYNYEFNYDGKADSQFSDGSDVIKNIPSYLSSRYGGDWYYDINNSNIIKNYVDVYQRDYAIYDNSEGNCTLSAFYGIFRYLRDYKNLKNLPTSFCNVNTSTDSFKNDHTVTRTVVPELYAKIRESAMNYGYTTNSTWWTSATMARWGNEALGNMGYKSDWYNSYVYMYLTWSFKAQVVKNIDAGYPVMWNQGRGNYSGHSMVVKGYKTYKQGHSFWFIKWSDSKHFMEMNDNWAGTGSSTYIDFDGYSNDLIHEGFGTFVVAKDYKW